MTGRTVHVWIGALALSVLVHGGMAAMLGEQAEEVQVAGGEPVEIAILGNAFEDATAVGDVAERLHPEPVETKNQPIPAATADTTSATDPRVAESALADAAEVADATVIETEGTVVMAETVAPTVEARRTPATADIRAEPAQPEEAEAIAPSETVNPLADAPIPMPRPDIESLMAERERAASRRRQQASRQEPRPQTSRREAQGSQDASQADAHRGDAAGSLEGRATQSTGQGRQASAAGDAAISNYPGQVVSQLRRSLSYPAQARRQRITGEVEVAFTIARNGGVSGVRIVRGSGHPVLDQAALDTVRRAAPFPGIPESANRSSWNFTVPLAFSR